MAATPQRAQFVFRGVSGKIYNVDSYLSDVANAFATFDVSAGAGTGSPTYWTAPENVTLVDYAQVTGTADTTCIQPLINGIPQGLILRYTVHLTSLNNRPILNLRIAQGNQLQCKQLA